MAGLAKGHQIVFCVCAAFADRKDVMHLFHGCEPTILQTNFTEGVGGGIFISYAFPRSAIGFVYIGSTFVFIVLSACCLSVFITEPPVTKVGATGVRTRALWLPRHHFTSLLGIRKATAGLLPLWPYLLSLHYNRTI